MKVSITKNRIINLIYKISAVLFWLLLWLVIALIIDNEFVLASPIDVISALFKLMGTGKFWLSIGNSFYKITSGFLIALLLGILLSIAAYNSRFVRELLSPVMSVINATPVVSFIIIIIFLVLTTSDIPMIISFIMVLPIIYTNMLAGLMSTDKKLLEMSNVFKVKKNKKLLFIYIPTSIPYFQTAVNLGLGICWKSGIAAELIAQTKNSIGNQIYLNKIYLEMKELLAWTLVIILISVIFRKLIMLLINYFKKRIEEH